MRLFFLAGDREVVLRVDRERGLFFSTDSREVDWKSMVDESNADKLDARVVDKIVKGEPLDNKELERYLVVECERQGLSFVRSYGSEPV